MSLYFHSVISSVLMCHRVIRRIFFSLGVKSEMLDRGRIVILIGNIHVRYSYLVKVSYQMFLLIVMLDCVTASSDRLDRPTGSHS